MPWQTANESPSKGQPEGCAHRSRLRQRVHEFAADGDKWRCNLRFNRTTTTRFCPYRIDHGTTTEFSAGTDSAIDAVKFLAAAGGLWRTRFVLQDLRASARRQAGRPQAPRVRTTGCPLLGDETEQFLQKAAEQAELDAGRREEVQKMRLDGGDWSVTARATAHGRSRELFSASETMILEKR
jgi:hypothetical protein